MKAYAVKVYYYDYCEVWENIDSFYLNQYKAMEREMEIQLEYESRGAEPDKEWVDITEIEIKE